jgi:alpha/beta superfamily hydrolase
MREQPFEVSSGEVRLVGTLCLPDDFPGSFAGALLLNGSGPLDRDSNMPKQRLDVANTFAHALAALGVASLRYDKRGVGESTGSYLNAGLVEETEDARVALAALRSDERCNGRVAVIGHSVGATIAIQLARSSPPPDAYVLLAGAAMSGAEVMEWQSHRIATTLPAPARWMASRIERRQARDRDQLLASTGDTMRLHREEMPARWFREYMAYDPASDLGAIAGPVLAITGGKDIQVDAGDVDRMRLLVTGPFVGETPDNLTHLLRSDEHRPGIRRYAAQLRRPVDPMLVERVATWTAATLR